MTFPGWWSQAGLPGFQPDGALAYGMPWTIAGLAAGGWELRDALAPGTLPSPGVAEAQPPLAWYDSAAVAVGRDAAWNGFGSGLVTARGILRPPAGGKPRAEFTLMSGTHGLDRDGISITHGNPDAWLRGGAVGDRRGGIGDLGPAGDHLWTMAIGRRRGPHAFEASFAQRGAGESQRAGAGESVRGQGGRAAWGVRFAGDSLAVRLARGFDTRNRFAIGDTASPTHRDGAENAAEIELRPGGEGAGWGVRLAASESRVVRVVDLPGGRDRTEWSDRTVWLAARAARPLAGGMLEGQLGGGIDRSIRHPVAAPGLTWEVRAPGRTLRLFMERAIVPVWSDLEPSTPAFMQDTWTGGLQAEAGADTSLHGSLVVLGGRAASRATLLRYPIRDVSLYLGWQRDLRPYRFLLMSGSAGGRWRALEADAGGFALARERATSQPQVDPALGARVGAGCRFRAFAGDLHVHLRVEGAYVGTRETDTRVPLLTDIVLPGYTSATLIAALGLGDATITLRGDGVGAERQPESWIDPSQVEGFILARDAGPVWRAEITWPLFN